MRKLIAPLLLWAALSAGQGKTLLPGFAMVHEHMFYVSPAAATGLKRTFNFVARAMLPVLRLPAEPPRKPAD